MSDIKKEDDKKVDNELSELLDSALQDFDDKPKTDVSKIESKTEEKSESSESSEPVNEEWTEEFMRQIVQNINPNVTDLFGLTGENGQRPTEEQIKQSFEQMAAASQMFLNENMEPSGDFATSISQAVQGLTQSSEQNLLGSLAGGGGDQNAFLPPFMQGMMQSLLSKEVLYPSLKDILDRFPEWIENNKNKISTEDKDRYEQQQKLMEEVCGVLMEEKDTDSEDLKKKRFESVLELMQKLQDYGQPPTDLVGDVMPPPDMSQCTVM